MKNEKNKYKVSKELYCTSDLFCKLYILTSLQIDCAVYIQNWFTHDLYCNQV